MIFKPSSLSKLFFTYICPRFYGGAPSTPSNTTTTSTVNQSPWQNPVYQALMLGTAEKPGPVTSMINASNEQMAQWNNINRVGLTPAAQASLGAWNPSTADTTATYVNQLNPYTGQYNAISGNIPREIGKEYQYSLGRAPDAEEQSYWANKMSDQGGSIKDVGASIADSQEAKNVAGLRQSYQTSLGRAPDASGQAYWLDSLNRGASQQDVAKSIADSQEAKAYAAKNASAAPAPGAAQGGLMGLSGYASGGKLSKEDTATINEIYKKYMGRAPDAEGLKYWGDKLASGTSAEDIATSIAASDEAKTYASGTHTPPYGLLDTLSKTAYFDPVTGKSTLNDFLAIQEKARNLETPAQFKAATDMYGQSSAGLAEAAKYKPTDVQAAQLTRGSVRDIAAQKAQVERYKAEMMNAPSDISAQNYQAALADLNQMQGPKSWIDKGTSEAYMSPYMQNVVDIQKREANRDYAKQLQELNKQATAAGAYGGSRQAIERSEAARNQATRLGDIEAQGLEKAYQSGMGQFSAEQGLGLQAGQANLSAAQQTAQQNQAAINQQRSQYIQQALQAAQVNYGGQLTAAQQNQVAQNAASQFNASAQNLANNNYSAQQLQAQQANQGVDFNVGQMNTANQQAARLANQQAGLTANQQGISALQGVGQNASGLAQTGSAQNTANLANLGAAGQVAQAEQNLGQQYLDTQTRNAQSWLNMPTSINAGASNVVNAQPVQGGTAGTTSSSKPASWARGGLIKNGKVSKRGVK